MERIKALNKYQKCVLLFITIIAVIFTIAYPVTVSRKGFEYKGEILVPKKENSGTVYSGKIRGKNAQFTLLSPNTVIFRYGDKVYGTYTAKKDPAALPADIESAKNIVGVELRHNGEILFRGGVMKYSGLFLRYNEDGSVENINVSVKVGGVEIDENGNPVDWMEPTAADILNLMAGNNISHKGNWAPWLLGIFLCVVTVISVLFADELFRFKLAFRINDVSMAQPSDFEIMGRYIVWTVMPIVATIIFITGLT